MSILVSQCYSKKKSKLVNIKSQNRVSSNTEFYLSLYKCKDIPSALSSPRCASTSTEWRLLQTIHAMVSMLNPTSPPSCSSLSNLIWTLNVAFWIGKGEHGEGGATHLLDLKWSLFPFILFCNDAYYELSVILEPAFQLRLHPFSGQKTAPSC